MLKNPGKSKISGVFPFYRGQSGKEPRPIIRLRFLDDRWLLRDIRQMSSLKIIHEARRQFGLWVFDGGFL
jgi:hypothetical protein